MKLHNCVIMGSAIVMQAGAASVLWNPVEIGSSAHQEIRVVRDDVRPYFWSVFDFAVTVSGDVATLAANPNGGSLTYAGAWASANRGDIVNSATALHADSYFEYLLLGNGDANVDAVMAEVGRVNYMMIVLQDGEQCFDYQDGMRTEMPDCYFGWLEYTVDQAGMVSVMRSAIDLSGGSILVGGGAIPEPSTAMLLLIGCAGLSLRRRRGNPKEKDWIRSWI